MGSNTAFTPLAAIQEAAAAEDSSNALASPHGEGASLKPARSLSDSAPRLSPSPRFKEPQTKTADDQPLLATPNRPTSRRTSLIANSFTLQMPSRDQSFNFASFSRANSTQQNEGTEPYTSPSNVLPRHSRGLEFARAATNLHHSTLAEQSSPDSSPTITHKNLSRRPSSASMALDTPHFSSSSWLNSIRGDKTLLSRSYGSTTALTSDASDSSSDDDDFLSRQDEMDDMMLHTPQIRKTDNATAVTPFDVPRKAIRSARKGSPMGNPNAKRRATLTRYHTPQKFTTSSSLEPAPWFDENTSMDEGYFGRQPQSRRESLSLGTNMLHISSHDSNDESPPTTTPATPGVVRRPVVRRSNLLPKTNQFRRIRAQLQEESAPVDCDVQREAEVVRQVRVNDVGTDRKSSVAPSSPNLLPTKPSLQPEVSNISDMDPLGITISNDMEESSNGLERTRSNSKEFWPHLYNRNQTPPPPNVFSSRRPRSSSAVSSDIAMDSPFAPTPPSGLLSRASTSISEIKNEAGSSKDLSDQSEFQAPNMPTAAEVSRKINAKRRRDEDWDIGSIKRRAVSPGMSVASSPTLGQSPVSSSGPWWGQQQQHAQQQGRQQSNVEERASSSGSTGHATPVLGPKRVGMQGMSDTNDAVMKMSLE